MILADISNKDAESFVDGLWNFGDTVFSAVNDFIQFVPPIVLGGIVVVLFLVYLYHKAKG
mgnify:CR=1 FL=1